MSEDLLVNLTGDVLEITLNRPERGNAMSDQMIRDLGDIVEREHEKVRLIVLRGNGDDFCAGRFNTGGARPNAPEALEVREFSDHVFRCYGLLRSSKAPVIAQVQGRALGFGFALAAAADITICADTAQFQVPEFNHNIMPTMVMSSMVDRVPLKALMYNVWTSQMISPERALAIGALGLAIALASCAKKGPDYRSLSDAGTVVDGGTQTSATAGEASTLNPILAGDSASTGAPALDTAS